MGEKIEIESVKKYQDSRNNWEKESRRDFEIHAHWHLNVEIVNFFSPWFLEHPMKIQLQNWRRKRKYSFVKVSTENEVEREIQKYSMIQLCTRGGVFSPLHSALLPLLFISSLDDKVTRDIVNSMKFTELGQPPLCWDSLKTWVSLFCGRNIWHLSNNVGGQVKAMPRGHIIDDGSIGTIFHPA